MIKIELLDHGMYVDGKHTADFEDLDDAKALAYRLVDTEHAKNVTIINNYTGEIEYTVDEVIVVKTERKVVEGN
jgi:phage replication-related protein YjqB (UPF0714/DUF867 family)